MLRKHRREKPAWLKRLQSPARWNWMHGKRSIRYYFILLKVRRTGDYSADERRGWLWNIDRTRARKPRR